MNLKESQSCPDSSCYQRFYMEKERDAFAVQQKIEHNPNNIQENYYYAQNNQQIQDNTIKFLSQDHFEDQNIHFQENLPSSQTIEISREINSNSQEDYSTSVSNCKERKKRKNRFGTTVRASCLKINKHFFGSCITKNFPQDITNKIRNHFKKYGKSDLIGKKKRLSVTQLKKLIDSNLLDQKDIKLIFDLDEIDEDIENSKKIGNSIKIKHLKHNVQDFLIFLTKELQKIMYRSGERVLQLLLKNKGSKQLIFNSYLDSEAHQQFHDLGRCLSKHKIYSQVYASIQLQINNKI